MEVLFIFVAIVALLALLDVAAIKDGVDSRFGSGDPHSPAGGLSL